jgi:hypothetical protein
MKHLKTLILCLFMIGGANVESMATPSQPYALVMDSTATKTPVNCPCDKQAKRKKKRNGKSRTPAGRVVYDILSVLKELIPLFGLIAK